MRAAGTLGPAIADFAAGCLVLPEGEFEGRPFRFEPWQERDTDVIYETDDRGVPLWKIVIYGLARGQGKSPLCGVYANHALVSGHGSPQVYCAAAAKKQAGVVHMYANKEARTEALRDFLEFPRVTTALGPINCPSNGGILRVVSADGDLQQGLAPAFVSVDELHTFRTGKQLSLFSAMLTAMHKRLDSRMIVITTAGPSKDCLLGELVDAIEDQGEIERSPDGCRTVVRDFDARRLIIWYGAPDDADIRDPKVWRACNPASWISDEALRIAAVQNPESEFRRYYLNQWVAGEEAAVQIGAWDACLGKTEIPKGAPVWVGVDLGEKRDTSAVVWVWPDPKTGRLVVRSLVFIAERTSGMETTLPQIEQALRGLASRYDVRRINFDQWQMRDLAARLASEGLPMHEFAQNNTNMVPASQLFFDMVGSGGFEHNGDKVLRAHVRATAGVLTATGGWRLTKQKTRGGHRDISRNNDACIALVMAAAGWKEDTTRRRRTPMVAFT